MKLLKKFLLSTLIVLTTLVMTSSTIPQIQTSYAAQSSAVRLNTTKKTLKVGKTYTLKISGTKKKVKWSSSKKSVATVSSKGKITAKKKGTATITAKVGNKKYNCKITVVNNSSSTVYITKTGKKYHRSGCSYLRKSKIKTTLSKAKSRGYTPCKRCYR